MYPHTALMLTVLSILGTTYALNCQKLDLGFLDVTVEVRNISRTPPTTTDVKVLFNPCSPVDGEPACSSDDKFCSLELIDGKLTAVKSFGSVRQGAKEQIILKGDSLDGPNEDIPGLPDDFNAPELTITYYGAIWGSEPLFANAFFICGDKDREPYIEYSSNQVNMFLERRRYCGMLQSTPDDQEEPRSGGFFGAIFGALRWLVKVLFWVIVLGAVIGALGLAISAFPQTRGINLSDTKAIIADLPYLIRDGFRKASSVFSRRSTSGYSAL